MGLVPVADQPGFRLRVGFLCDEGVIHVVHRVVVRLVAQLPARVQYLAGFVVRILGPLRQRVPGGSECSVRLLVLGFQVGVGRVGERLVRMRLQCRGLQHQLGERRCFSLFVQRVPLHHDLLRVGLNLLARRIRHLLQMDVRLQRLQFLSEALDELRVGEPHRREFVPRVLNVSPSAAVQFAARKQVSNTLHYRRRGGEITRAVRQGSLLRRVREFQCRSAVRHIDDVLRRELVGVAEPETSQGGFHRRDHGTEPAFQRTFAHHGDSRWVGTMQYCFFDEVRDELGLLLPLSDTRGTSNSQFRQRILNFARPLGPLLDLRDELIVLCLAEQIHQTNVNPEFV